MVRLQAPLIICLRLWICLLYTSAPKAEDPDIVDDSEVTKTQKSVTPPPAAPTTETSADTGDDIYKGLHPAVRARLEALEKRAAEAEERELLDVAKKYEIVGEKPEELVKTLKSLKDAGGTAYNDMISVLDRSVDIDVYKRQEYL